MKKTKLMLALAVAIAMFSFGFKAKAQATIPVVLASRSGSYTLSNWTTSTTVWVTMHNETTNEDFYFETSPYNYDSGTDTFQLGDVTPGDYTVTFSYYNGNISSDYFDWEVGDRYGYSKFMYGGNDYVMATGVAASTAIGEFDLMLYHI